MADLSEVGNALVELIAQAAYPRGIEQPAIVDSDIAVYQGWPKASALEAALKANAVHISVFPRPGAKIRTPVSSDWEALSIEAPTLTATVTGTTLTLGGTVQVPQTVALRVDQADFAYPVRETDTLPDIAAELAALIKIKRPATATGAMVSIPGAYRLMARIGTRGEGRRTLRWQVQTFQITVWASGRAVRDRVAAAVDIALAALCRIALPDGSTGIVRYGGSVQGDDWQKQGVYRRDLFYEVDYETAITQPAATVTLPQLNMQGPARTIYL